MSGMLFQIERRLAALQTARSQNVTETTSEQPLGRPDEISQPDAPRPKKVGKTVGVVVEPKLYAALSELCKQRGLKSIKAALLLAAEEGVRHLG